ncbi:MAG: methionine biosynthesis protein MetW [Beggiatoa sp. IS2]|nr:MAG: methionine biosynthesis protein MetW [Beggiatoa sp. IS2]
MILRTDLQLISEWITPRSHVLDLGCGDGRLLAYLRETSQSTGYGLEINDNNIIRCIEAGVSVIQRDLDEGLADFADNSFDYVIMTQTLQAIYRPDLLLQEMLRVGREGIVTFLNFGHWACRLQLLLGGNMPKTATSSDQWYNTENIHLCTLHDFEELCTQLGIKVLQRAVVDSTHRTRLGMRLLPNLFGEIALYRFCRNW